MTTGGSNLGEATLRLSTDAKGLTKDLDQVEKSTAQRLGNVGKTLTKTLTPAALGIGAAVFKASQDIDEAFATIRTGTGATGETLEGLQEDFKAVYGSVPADSQTVAAAIAEVNTRLGLSGEALQEVTKTALELADATGGDATDAIKKTVQAMKVFDREGEDAAETMDKFFVVAQDTGITVDELTSQMQTFGPVLRNAGFSMDEATAIFGQLNAEGVDASRVFPGLNTFFRRTAEAGGDMRQSFEEVTSRIQDATSNTEALNIATEAFGAEGAQRLVVAVQNGAFGIDEMVGSFENASGAVLQNAEDTRTATERFAMMRREVGEKLAGAFQSLPGPVQAAAVGLTGAAAAAGPLLMALPGILKVTKALNLANLKNATTSAAATAATIAKRIAEVAGAVAIKAVTAAQWLWNAAMTANPIGIIIVAIGALIAAVILIWKNWDTVREKTIEIWNKVKDFLGDIFGQISERIQEWVGQIRDFFTGLWEGIAGGLKSALNVVIRALNKALNVAGGLVEKIKGALDKIPGPNPAGNFLLGVAGNLRSGIPELAEGGIVRMPTLAIAGEAGPEAVIPLGRLDSLIGGGNRGTEIHIHGDLYGYDDFAQKVGEAGIYLDRGGRQKVLR